MYNINKVEDPFLFTTQMQSAPSVFYMTFTRLSVFCESSLFNLFQARLQIIVQIKTTVIIVPIAWWIFEVVATLNQILVSWKKRKRAQSGMCFGKFKVSVDEQLNRMLLKMQYTLETNDNPYVLASSEYETIYRIRCGSFTSNWDVNSLGRRK